MNQHAITGQITGANGTAVAGVTVSLSGAQVGSAITSSNGTYTFNLTAGGNYTLAPAKQNYVFSPASWVFNDLGANQVANFTGALVDYSIAGQVTHATGQGFSGATVTLSGSQAATTTTDASGNYSFGATGDGSYTVSVAKVHYTFAPPSASFSNLSANKTANFTGTLNQHSITGQVISSNGNALAGVTVSLSGTQVATTITSATGIYSFNNLAAAGNYTLRPAKQNYVFSPPTRVFDDLGANEVANITGALVSYSIAGRVFNAAGQGISGATVTLSGSQAATTTTNSSGNYSFLAAAEGSYTLSVAKVHHTFAPSNSSFSNLSGNRTANFTGTLDQHSITGLISSSDGTALAGVGLTLSGSDTALATTGADGRFSFTVPAGGTYTVVPTKTNHRFTPVSATFSDLNSNQVVDFGAALIKTLEFGAAVYQILEGEISLIITVIRNGDTSGSASATYSTSAHSGINNCHIPHTEEASSGCDYITSIGTVRFAPGETSKTFSIPIIDDGYAEGSENFEVTLSNLVGANMGSQSTAGVTITDDETVDGANPIEGAGSFVRQHYIDFFNREPDAAGLAFWINQITSCGTDPVCVDVRRANASAAFFLAIEFRETGYLVYRTYKAAYGNLPDAPVPVKFDEFLPGTRQIGQEVVVGKPGWEELLQNNKQVFAAEFVARSRFANAYPTTLTPTEFVDVLFTNAGVTPSADERTAAVSEFGSEGTSADMTARGRALLRVAENQTLAQQEFNKAFVLTQYFGYLRRNPNDAPEATLDFQGYNFWLGKLNQFNGNFVAADMVKAFIISSEYRQRFGP
ncbi:MAG: carboxypeptidase regulatory-like domain-containing protein [Pyrinomonadaceae bacterium]